MKRYVKYTINAIRIGFCYRRSETSTILIKPNDSITSNEVDNKVKEGVNVPKSNEENVLKAENENSNAEVQKTEEDLRVEVVEVSTSIEKFVDKQDQKKEQIQASNITIPRLIAHAGGDIHGITLSNTINAFDASYDEGFRWIEVDISYTSDRVPVCAHDWGNANWLRYNMRSHTVPSLKEFSELKGVINLEMATLDKLESWLSKHPDAYIVTDVKAYNVDFLTSIKENYKILYKHLIPQIYSFEEYDQVYKLGYENIILTLYKITVTNEEILEFCLNNKLVAVTMPQVRAMESLPKLLGEINIPTYAHTINNFVEYRLLRDNGVYGVYTDYFEPNNWIE